MHSGSVGSGFGSGSRFGTGPKTKLNNKSQIINKRDDYTFWATMPLLTL